MSLSVSFDGGPPLACSDWTIREPLRGRWTALLNLRTPDAPPAIGARASLAEGLWSGTAVSVLVLGATLSVSLVGGANALDKLTSPKQYIQGASRASVLADLCNAAGERAGADSVTVQNWRARGEALRVELRRLSRDWFVAADGSIGLAREPRTVQAPGNALRAEGDGIVYACDGAPPFAGATLGGAVVECAILTPAYATLFPARPVIADSPMVVAGTIVSLSGGRASINLDNGETLNEVPLFCAAGYVPEGASQVRVLVLDIADAGNTIAITGVDGRIDGLTIGNASDVGYLLRSGERVMVSGLVSAAPGSPVVSPPGAVTIMLDPTIQNNPGPPGAGRSRTKG